jgi:hypothetical protein
LASKQRVESRKNIKALRNKAAAEERAKNQKVLNIPKEKVPNIPKEPRVRISCPVQQQKKISEQRLSRVDNRVSEDESAYSSSNRNIAEISLAVPKNLSFEEKINRDAVNYEVRNIFCNDLFYYNLVSLFCGFFVFGNFASFIVVHC